MRLLTSLLFSLSCVGLAFGEPRPLPGKNMTGVVEVDLVFPGNETYALLPRIPIVFAFWNALPETFLDPSFKLELWSTKQNQTMTSKYGWLGALENRDKTDPFFSYWGFEELNTEDHWVLTWSLGWHSCSLDSPVGGKPGLFQKDFSSIVGGRLEFTTTNSSKPLDLQAALQEHACTRSTSRALLNVTDYTYTPDSVLPGGVACPIVANATAAEGPCTVQIDKAAAKSMDARLKAQAPWLNAAPHLAAGGAAWAGILAAAVLGGMATYLGPF